MSALDAFRIGDNQDSGGQQWHYNGDLDEVRVSDAVRSAEYIEASYRAGSDNMLAYGVEENSTDPVLYFNFNDAFASTTATTTQIFDQTSNNNDGQAFGAAWTPNGKFDGAMDFDGTDDYIDIATTSLPTTAISVSAWVKVDTHKSWNRFVTNDWNSEGDWLLFSNTSNWTWGIRSPGTTQKQITTPHNSDTGWHHLEGTYDGTTQRFYVDGIEVGTALTHSVTLSQDQLRLSETGGTNTLDGLLDEVKIYNYARSAEEVLVDYNAGTSVLLGSGRQFTSTSTIGHWSFDQGAPNDADPNLVGCWKFNEHSGTTANDCSQNSNSGTIDGIWANGVTGESSIGTNSAIDLNGSSDEILITDHDSLSFGDGTTDAPFSISAWINMDDATSFPIFSKGDSTNKEYTLAIDSGDSIRLELDDDTSSNRLRQYGVTGAMTADENTWVMVTATYNGNSALTGIRLYRNGVEMAYGSGVEDGTYVAMSNEAEQAVIGRSWNNSSTYADGTVDDVRLFNKALTPAEVYSLYSSGTAQDRGSDSTTDLANANDGQLHGPSWRRASQCKKGKCLEFDGSNDYVDLDGITLARGDDFSIAAWFNAQTIDTTRSVIVADNSENINFIVFEESGTDYVCTTWGDVSCSSGMRHAVSLNTWYHGVLTSDGSGGLQLYVDGIKQGSATGKSTSGSQLELNIGGRSSGFNFDGKIDDVRIFDYVLDQSDIMQLYNGGAPVAHYKFNENASTTAYDTSSYDNDGTLTNFPTDSSNWVSGKYGRGLLFDGVNDQITVSNSDSANIQGDLSIGAWVNSQDFSTTTDSYIIQKDSGSVGYSFGYGITTASKLGLEIDGTVYESDTTFSVTDSAWNHFMVSLTGTSAVFYVNGNALGSAVTATLAPSADNSAVTLRIGSDNTSFTKGSIDDVRIYNYPRSAAQVLIDYNNGFSTRFGD